MAKTKQVLTLLLRLAMVYTAMLIAYVLGTMVIGQDGTILSPQETRQAGKALLIASLASGLVLSFPILRSRYYGLKLVGVTFVVHFGVETFMTQIETLYFNSAVQMEASMFVGIVAAGAIRALVFAPLAVFILGKMKRPAQPQTKRTMATGWGQRFIALSLLYPIIYFLFGYFVAWQWKETRLYYTRMTAIKPFFTHFWDLFVREDPAIIPFQVLRGALWTGLSSAIVHTMKAKRWQVALAVALIYAVLIALPLGLFPNPYMPPAVAQSHFCEIASSMLLFGGISGWVLYERNERRMVRAGKRNEVQEWTS